ncbi:hypothetical protein L208DRAFT_455946 [Tricholoma matsutake]|nr:hypothetical protein L208DRAFT_455946 [Tricholoma matsutake 945]
MKQLKLKRLGMVTCDRCCWRAPAPLPLSSQDCQIEKFSLEALELGERSSSVMSNTWATIMAILRSESRQGVHELQGIESLMWLDSEFHMMTFGETFVPFEMGIFPRLRFLGFCIRGVQNSNGRADLLKVTLMLKNGAIPNTLEELSIILESYSSGGIPNTLEELSIISESYSSGGTFNYRSGDGAIVGVSDVCSFFGRSGFDVALVAGSRAYPNLRKVNIFVEKMRQDDHETLHSLLPRELPLLADKGMLFVSLCDKNEVLAGVSSFLPKH